MNNGILAPQPFSAGTDLVGIKPLLGVPQSIPTPYHLPKSNDYMIGNSDGTSSEDYVIVVDTSKGSGTSIFLTIFAQGGGYLNIDWGDGTHGALIPSGATNVRRPGSYETKLEFTSSSSFLTSHTYPKHGIYRIVTKGILGTTATAAAPLVAPASTLVSVESFGKEVNRIGSINYNGATNLIYTPPYLSSGVTSLSTAFNGCSNLNQKNIARWDVSRVTSFLQTFANITKFPIEGDWNWDTRNGNMFQMFAAAQNINNINFSGWVFNAGMNEIFRGTTINNCSFINWSGADSRFGFRNAFLKDCTFSGWRITSLAAPMFGLGISNYAGWTNLYLPSWDLRGVTDLTNMFYGSDGTMSGLDNWNVSGVTNMTSMFQYGSDFMTADLSNWDIRKVTSFDRFMQRAVIGSISGTSNIRINNWAIPSGASLSAMFGDPFVDKFISLSGWSFGGNSAARMFGTVNITPTQMGLICNLSSWNTSGIYDMTRMFEGCSTLSIGDISNWNTSSVTGMSSMFQNCNNFNTSVSGWDTGKVTNMSLMFYDARIFLGRGLENWNTSNVTNMSGMFQMVVGTGPNANLSGWNTGKVTNMSNMFSSSNDRIHRFAGSGIDNWNVTGVTTVNSMFRSNAALNTTLKCNLSGWNLCNCTDMTNFMQQCNIGSGNYDILLNSWEITSTGNPVKPWATGINVHFGTARYTAASSGARQRLVNYGWTITDGGFQA